MYKPFQQSATKALAPSKRKPLLSNTNHRNHRHKKSHKKIKSSQNNSNNGKKFISSNHISNSSKSYQILLNNKNDSAAQIRYNNSDKEFQNISLIAEKAEITTQLNKQHGNDSLDSLNQLFFNKVDQKDEDENSSVEIYTKNNDYSEGENLNNNSSSLDLTGMDDDQEDWSMLHTQYAKVFEKDLSGDANVKALQYVQQQIRAGGWCQENKSGRTDEKGYPNKRNSAFQGLSYFAQARRIALGSNKNSQTLLQKQKLQKRDQGRGYQVQGQQNRKNNILLSHSQEAASPTYLSQIEKIRKLKIQISKLKQQKIKIVEAERSNNLIGQDVIQISENRSYRLLNQNEKYELYQNSSSSVFHHYHPSLKDKQNLSTENLFKGQSLEESKIEPNQQQYEQEQDDQEQEDQRENDDENSEQRIIPKAREKILNLKHNRMAENKNQNNNIQIQQLPNFHDDGEENEDAGEEVLERNDCLDQQQNQEEEQNQGQEDSQFADQAPYHQGQTHNQQEQFINFVNEEKKNGNNKNDISLNNISKIMNVKQRELHNKSLENEAKQKEEDQVVAMLENQLRGKKIVQEEPDQTQEVDRQHLVRAAKGSKLNNQILKELQTQKSFELQNALHLIFQRRDMWIRSRKDKDQAWREQELSLIEKMKKILHNPYFQ